MGEITDLARQGMGSIASTVQSHGDKLASDAAAKRKEADRNRPIRPGIAKALGLSPDDEQEAMDLIQSGENPKHVALYMRSKSQQQQPAEATFQGVAPGSAGQLSGNAMSMANREPKPFPEQGLGALAPRQQPQGLGAATQKPAPKPYTSRDLEDLQTGAGYLRASREPVPRETPEQRATREQNNIKATGEQARNTEGAKQGGRVQLQGAALGVQQEGIGAANNRNTESVQAQLKIAKDKLAYLREESDIRGADKTADHEFATAEKAVADLRNAMVKMRTADTEITQDPESAAVSSQLEVEYKDAIKQLNELRDRRKGSSHTEPSESHRVRTSTPVGAAPQPTAPNSGGEQIRIAPDGRKLKKMADGSIVVVP